MEQNQVHVALAFARRNWWILLQSVVVVTCVAVVLTMRAPLGAYQASSVVQVQPSRAQASFGAASYLAAVQRRAVGQPVAAAVAEALARDDADVLRRMVSVTVDTTTMTVTFTAVQPDAADALAVANQWAASFVTLESAEQNAELQARVDDLQRQLDELDVKMAGLDAEIARALAAGTDASASVVAKESLSRRYDTLFTAQSDLLTTISSQANPADVLALAEDAHRPSPPSPLSRGALGVVAGLVLGVGLAVLRELLRDRVRDRADAEALTGLPVLATVPALRYGAKGLPAADAPHGEVSESMRSLRTSLQFLGTTRRMAVIGITSGQPGDGKTLVAMNLAASFAQTGATTVLVSADLRNPAVDRMFGVDGRPGLADVLERYAVAPPASATMPHSLYPDYLGLLGDLGSLLQPTRIPNLRVMPAGRPVRHSTELWARDDAKDVFKAMHELADVVIVDTPPLVVNDPLLIAKAADGIVMITAVGASRRARVQEGLERLRQQGVSVLGTVINRTERQVGGNYYDYYGARQEKAAAGTRRRSSSLNYRQ